MSKFERWEAEGHTFVFKKDDVATDMLHIYARHLTTPDNAIDTFFDATKTVWNKNHQRYEYSTDAYTLYWYWIDESLKVVMVVSCFRSD